MSVRLIHGDCLRELKNLPSNSIDSIVTDPPYGLGVVKDLPGLIRSWLDGGDGDGHVGAGGFMGKEWDKSVPPPKVWKECIRVLKPGGHMLVFAGTRTQDLMGISIRLAGAELRDEITCLGQVTWVYGQGFPKSMDISKAIDKQAGAEREVVGVHYRHGGGSRSSNSMGDKGTDSELPLTAPSTDEAKKWSGFGTALKPAHEPILVFRKPISEGTVADNVIKHSTGGLNIDGCRIKSVNNEHYRRGVVNSYKRIFGACSFVPTNSDLGRFPSNVILAHHPECDAECHSDCPVGQMPYSESSTVAASQRKAENKIYGKKPKNPKGVWPGNSGSAARFFYVSKASPKDRDDGVEGENNHPTVKPTDLMRYLCRLVTPPGGTVLDPFMGSGSTGKGAALEGFSFIGVEREEGYVEIAKARIDHALGMVSDMGLMIEKPEYKVMTKAHIEVLKKKIRDKDQLSLF